jgi:hypothetical protein
MYTLIAGLIVFAATIGVFLFLRPRDGQRHRWVDTEWEPYIAVSICAGLALGFTMVLSSLINLYG